MKLGFIGCGNMASAIIGGVIKAGLYKCDDIIASCSSQANADKKSKELGIKVVCDNNQVVDFADIVVLAIKPGKFSEVLPALSQKLSDKLIISIAAGLTVDNICKMAQLNLMSARVIRVMPNTPALVGEGMSALCIGDGALDGAVSEDDMKLALDIFASLGKAEIVSEKLMDTVTGVSGSSPAYVYMFIEAMADAAVADGMPRNQAYTFAAQSVLGAAKMVLEIKKVPGELKDAVCSPGGTTIEAVAVLEKMGMRSAVIEAQRACVKKSKSLGE